MGFSFCSCPGRGAATAQLDCCHFGISFGAYYDRAYIGYIKAQILVNESPSGDQLITLIPPERIKPQLWGRPFTVHQEASTVGKTMETSS